jgi:hypothetical protein
LHVASLQREIAVATDKILMRELRSLQDELSTSQRERLEKRAAPSAPDTGTPATAASSPPAPSPADVVVEEQEHQVELNDLIEEIKEFFETAEKNIAAHPTASVVAALLLGILIGRTLGGRS